MVTMILRKAITGIVFSVSLLHSAKAQETPQLQQRPAASNNPNRPAPPAPLKAPETLETAKMPNANAVYRALRARMPGGPSFKVHGVTLKRDVGELRLTDGIVTSTTK
jgi:hypothetical protein